ncbi:hypothetical protein ACOSQ2_015912 [Xanthoceras sorbifolium]
MDIKRVIFSVKSFLVALIDDPPHPIFKPRNTIWKAKVPNKVKLLVWSIAWGRVNTNDLLQKKRPGMALSPNWCIMCKRNLESSNHFCFHCSIVWSYGANCFKNLI